MLAAGFNGLPHFFSSVDFAKSFKLLDAGGRGDVDLGEVVADDVKTSKQDAAFT